MPIGQYKLVLDNLLAKKAKDYTEKEHESLLKDLQANILKSHGKKHAIHAFIQFNSPFKKEISNWLSELPITSAWQQLEERYGNRKKTPVVTNLYLTHDGYEYLGYDYKKIPESGAMPFSQGPQSRLTLDVDLEENKLPTFEKVHAMLLLAGDDEKELFGKLKLHLNKENIKILKSNREEKSTGKGGKAFIQYGERKETGEFGFVDRSNNPLFFPNPEKIDSIPLEEIESLETVLVKDPNGANWDSCGSFLAFLKLEQNTDAFNLAGKELEKKTKSSPDLAKSLIVGKLPKNTIGGDIYLSEQKGFSKKKGCPFRGPHIQVAREATKKSGSRPMVRRGIQYNDYGGGKGLLFLSFQSSIKHQFEYMINRFMTNRKDMAVDPLLYNHNLKPSLVLEFPVTNSRDTAEVSFTKSFVTLKKGFYLFAPSLSSIEKLKNK